MAEVLLGVNIDHIATVRNARGIDYPDPVYAAFVSEQAGADSITVHLREDRRHITERDVRMLRTSIKTHMNLEMAMTDEMINIACKIKPHLVCLVPENRQEITTEGGLNVVAQQATINVVQKQFKKEGILVSLFIDPDFNQIEAAAASGVPYIELHTGKYAAAPKGKVCMEELKRIYDAVNFASSFNLKINAGHGLTYHNVQPIASLQKVYELNIGHSIISRALFIGLKDAVKEMKQLMRDARQ